MEIFASLNIDSFTSIHRSQDATVYRAVRKCDRTPIIVKVLNAESPSPEVIYRHNREYEITRNPACDFIVKSDNIESHHRSRAIVFEDFGGVSLAQLIRTFGGFWGENYTLESFLRLAIQIAGAIETIHARNIVHNYLDLSHIILNPKIGTLKAISFGRATLLNPDLNAKKIDAIFQNNRLEASKKSDHHGLFEADIYGLGRIFYRLLTSQLLWDIDDPVAWLDSRLQQSPISPSQICPEIPEPLSDLILGLLSKSPENRDLSVGRIRLNLEKILAAIAPHNFNSQSNLFYNKKSGEILSNIEAPKKNAEKFYIHYSKLVHFYRLEDYQLALNHANLAQQYIDENSRFLYFGDHQFYHALALAAAARTARREDRERIVSKIDEIRTAMAAWANHNPAHFQHRLTLVAAECDRLCGEILRAEEKYEQAISGAIEIGSIHDEALACELAADFYRSRQLNRIFGFYLKAACDAYSRLQLTSKVKDIETRHPHIFTPTSPGLSQPFAPENSSPSSAVNLSRVLQAYQTLSGEIILATLLAKTMKILIENTGAEIGYLLLSFSPESEAEPGHRWRIEAIAEMDVERVTVLRSIPLDTLADRQFPKSIVRHVAATRESIVLGEAVREKQWMGDEYIQTHRPQSLLCTPLIRKRQLMGILYLENNQMTNVFTAERIEILSLLSAQVAISLENAFLYKTLEQKVGERTAELSQTLEHLKATQDQLIEAEKMAALAGLVGGVAHEINTPVGTGILAASFLAGETDKFAQLCRSGSLKRSALNAYLEVAAESSQLILENLQRAARLVQSFQKVAVDQTSLERRTFLLKPYLEEILLSLGPKFKQTAHRISVEGDETIEIDSYPGALSQIITNLVMNSLIHAYEPSQSGQLRLQVAALGDRFTIRYGDDGCGIPAEHLGKIFDPFFTTGRSRGGSGLGLHIVYNLVTQTLKGTVRCESRENVSTEFIIDCPRTPE
ncbi:MAG: ATP-binding protein [Limnospira sp.]